jgi:hypothetical protein
MEGMMRVSIPSEFDITAQSSQPLAIIVDIDPVQAPKRALPSTLMSCFVSVDSTQ